MSCIKNLFLSFLIIILISCNSFAVTEDCVEARDWLNRGLFLHDGSQKEIQHYKKAVQLCPDLIAVYNRIGEIYRKRGELELARQAFDTAKSKGDENSLQTSLQPIPDSNKEIHTPDTTNNILTSNDSTFASAASAVPEKDYTTLDNCTVARGLVHQGLFLHDGSDKEIAYYQTAVELCSELVPVYNRIGEIYKKRGEHELAGHAFKLAGTKGNFTSTQLYDYLIATKKDDEHSADILSDPLLTLPDNNTETVSSFSPYIYGSRKRPSIGINKLPDNCTDGRNWFHLGVLLHNDSDKEISYYKKAIELCPELTPTYSRVGEIYKRRGEFELAYYAFQMAESNIDFTSQTNNNTADQCSEAKDLLVDGLTLKKGDPNQEIFFQRALSLCDTLSTTFEKIGTINKNTLSDQLTPPDCNKAKTLLSSTLHGQNSPDNDSDSFQKAIDLCPSLGFSFNQLGQFYQNFKTEQLFIAELDDNSQAQFATSETLPDLKTTEDTTTIPGFTIKQDLLPNDCDEARKWFNEGISLRDNSKREASYYEKAIELCPDFAEAYNKLGKVYKTIGEYDLAIKAFRNAKTKSLLAGKKTLIVEPARELGEIYRRQSKFDLAADEFKNILEVEPDSRFAQNQLEYIYKRTGKYELATNTPQEMLTNATFTRISGMALPKGTYLTDFQIQHWVQRATLSQEVFTEEVPLAIAPTTTETDVTVLIWGLRYGLTNRFTIGVIPKAFSRRAHVPNNETGVETTPEVNGLGDTVVMGKYLLWGVRQQHLSGYTLLSIPTGDEKAQGINQGVVRNMPLGSGSYDFTTGLSFSSIINMETFHKSLVDMDPFTFHANMFYQFTDGREVGDEFDINLALTHSIREYVSYALELNYRWRDEIKRTQILTIFQQRPDVTGPAFAPIFLGTEDIEVQVIDTGGHTLFFSPSMQFELDKGLKLEMGVQIPFIAPEFSATEDMIYHLGITKFIY